MEIRSALSGCSIALKLPYLLCDRDKADTYRLIRGHLSTSTIPWFLVFISPCSIHRSFAVVAWRAKRQRRVPSEDARASGSKTHRVLDKSLSDQSAKQTRLVRACRTAGSPTAWRPKKTQRAGARRCGKTFTSTAASLERDILAGKHGDLLCWAARRPASPETPARRRQRKQRAQSRMSACGRGNFRAPAQKSCGQLPARMSFCSLLPRACCLSAAFFVAASESKAAMKRPATRGQAMQKQGQRTQKKPAAAQNQKLPEPLRRRVGWSRVTAAQLLECREDYQDGAWPRRAKLQGVRSQPLLGHAARPRPRARSPAAALSWARPVRL